MKIKLIFHGSLIKYNDNKPDVLLEIPDGSEVLQVIVSSGVPREEIAFAAVNGSRVPLNYRLKQGDEVKLFQLVGGG